MLDFPYQTAISDGDGRLHILILAEDLRLSLRPELDQVGLYSEWCGVQAMGDRVVHLAIHCEFEAPSLRSCKLLNLQ